MAGSRHFALDHLTAATASDAMAVISEVEATWDVEWKSIGPVQNDTLARGGGMADSGIFSGCTRTYIEEYTYHLIKYKCMRDEILYFLSPDLVYRDASREPLVCPAEES
jgi:hypothetical protein